MAQTASTSWGTSGPSPGVIKTLLLCELLFAIPLYFNEYLIAFAAFFGSIALVLIVLNPVNGLLLLPMFIFMPFQIPGMGGIQFSELGTLIVLLSFCFHILVVRGSLKFDVPAIGPITIILLASCLSTINANYFWASTKNILKFIEGFVLIYVLTVNYVKKPATIQHILFSTLLAGLLASIIGIARYVAGYETRVFGMLGGSFGAYIGICLVIAFNLILYSSNQAYKIVAILVMPVLWAALILSQTRAWLLGTLIALPLIFMMQGRSRRSFLTAALVGTVAVAVYLVLATDFIHLAGTGAGLISSGAEKALQTGLDSRSQYGKYVSLLMRVFLWTRGFAIYMQNPIFGFGIGNLRFRSAFTGELGPPSDPHVGYVDNHWLNVLYETGVLGIVGWIWLAIVLYRTCKELTRKSSNSDMDGVRLSLIGAIIILFVGSMFWTLTVVHEMTVFLAFLIGLIMASRRIEGPTKSE